MRYTPHTPSDQRQMLEAIGLKEVDGLFSHIPSSIRERARISLPPGLSEVEVMRRMTSLAAQNATAADWSFFLGGGIYHHFIPSTVDAIVSRSEFATSYTPYQPEVSQGTLQALFEFQTLICQLTGMEVANAGLYDGASAAAEAVLMARRIHPKSRRKVFLSRSLHPQYRAVIQTYVNNLEEIQLCELPFDSSGRTESESLVRELDESALCVLVGYPNFFGIIENLSLVQEACARAGALVVTVTTEPLSLALLKPPGAWEADIAVGEGQSLGVPMALGGPGFGFFACRKKFMRSMPGRLVGETVDGDGRRGYVLTLSTREQHIRRDKATSNICTSQTLCTLAATVFMATLGKTGMRRVAEINAVRAHEGKERLVEEAGLEPVFDGPFFNEFVLRVHDLDRRLRRLADQRMVPGVCLGRWYPEFQDCLLLCVTEMNDREEIDRLVHAFARQ